jgi:class 3 adenylate cyclase
MGVHVGEPKRLTDAVTRRVEFVGPPVNTAARLTTLAHGGQILLSESAWERLKQADWLKERNRCACLGKFELTDSLPGTGLCCANCAQ